MRKKINILKKASVLLVALAMVLTVLPAVSADSNVPVERSPLSIQMSSVCSPNPKAPHRPAPAMQEANTGSLAGVGAPYFWYSYNTGYTDNAMRWTDFSDVYWAIELSGTDLDPYRGDAIEEILFSVGADAYYFMAVPYEIFIYDGDITGVDVTTLTAVGSGVSDDTQWTLHTLSSPHTIPMSGSVFVIIRSYDYTSNDYPAGFDMAAPYDARGDWIVDHGTTNSWSHYGDGMWGIDVGIGAGGDDDDDDDDDECLEDQCDFEILGWDDPYNYNGLLNSFPKLIRIFIRNNGDVPISELKLLADVYEKVCGETSILWCDEKYDLRYWEDEVVGVWEIGDDGDGDSFVLQGGPDRRWLTNNQAWRNTAGKDRSYGGDEDKYLGLDSAAVGYDTLTWAPVDPDMNDISGALYSKLTFSSWCEGEFTYDDDDNLVPIDYGFMEYSLNGGLNWTQLALSDFIACDTNGEWEEYTIWFLNEALYGSTYHPGVGAYVCEFQPDEDDIVIAEDYPTEARLQIRFTWIKDPCLQFEGWYIDEFCLERTEKYTELLIFQTHEILNLEACTDDILYTFPLGWEPEDGKWYTIKICGQVFSPSGCEIDVENNCIEAQFYVDDILDVACKSMEITSEPPFHSGDCINVNMTVENLGTLAVTDVPVNLRVADAIAEYQHKDYFETDPAGKYDLIWFVGTEQAEVRWSKGDPTISDIYDIDEASARSVLPGSECMVFGEQGVLYPYVVDGTSVGLIPGSYYDFYDYRDAIQAKLTFYMKYSFGPGAYSVIMFNQPSMGTLWSGYYIATPSSYSNEWEFFDFDLKDEQANLDYPDEPMRFTIVLFAEGPLGSATPNPIPWSGMLLDNLKIYTAFPGTGGVIVDSTIIPGPLAPGAEATVQLSYCDAEFCTHSLIGEVKKSGDMNSFNDECSDVAKVSDFTTIKEFSAVDLSEVYEDCLWHLCDTRGGGDNNYAWAGVEEGTWAHYVNNMNDNFISPPINLSGNTLGAALNFTTWYEFYDTGDFGEVYARNASGASWVLLKEWFTSEKKLSGTSGGFFEGRTYYLAPELCSENTQIRFRMKSNSEGVGEGWYVDDVQIIDITGFGSFNNFAYAWLGYTDGHTESAWRWTAMTPWLEAIELSDPELAPYRGEVIDEIHISVGDDVYGFEVCDYRIWVVDGALPALPIALTPDAIGVSSGTGWDYVTIPAHDIPATGSVFILAEFSNYDAYPAGWDDNCPYDARGDWLDYNSVWTSFGTASGYYGVWGIEAGISAGGPSGTLLFGDEMFFDNFEKKLNHLGENSWELDLLVPRASIAPWTCESILAGNFWRHYLTDTGYLPEGVTEDCDGDDDWWVIHGYTGNDALNNALYAKIDLTGIEKYPGVVDDITNADISFCTAWNVEDAAEMFIEISANWDGTSPMSDAVWVPYWHFPDGIYGTNSGGWITSDDLVDDPSNRWSMNQYLGQEIYIRFRYVTPGDGFTIVTDHGWAVDGLTLHYKTVGAGPVIDTVPPVTSIFFNQLTASVTLVAVDYPLDKNVGVKATYYQIGSGAQQTYSMPFTIPEGTSTIKYWSVDNNNNVEAAKSVTYTVDTTAPVLTGFTEPVEGGLYLFGSFIMNRLLAATTLCIGKVPVAVTATDVGSGVKMVLFSFSDGQTAFDDTPGNGFTTTWKGRNFGDLTITAKARDGKGLESAPQSMTITVYSLGLF